MTNQQQTCARLYVEGYSYHAAAHLAGYKSKSNTYAACLAVYKCRPAEARKRYGIAPAYDPKDQRTDRSIEAVRRYVAGESATVIARDLGYASGSVVCSLVRRNCGVQRSQDARLRLPLANGRTG